ncbi:Hypp8425 [Branchiostoma lanceolatum]|uniref:Hypp8425 protein n=1 Tax=Branchiostoma lanceolatum TaxID=7740 RepID=A0A8J9Z7L3_BRALA|nr:Hypp8425 [Branchiostoma lanceolatum]
MNEAYSLYPTQSSFEYLKKLLKYSVATVGLNWPFLTGYGVFVLQNVLGIDHQKMWISLLRGFPDQFFQKIRQQPSAGLLSLLVHRCIGYRQKSFQVGVDKGRHADMLLKNPSMMKVGDKADNRNYWLFPILVEKPDEVIDSLCKKGINAYRGATQLNVIEPPSETSHHLTEQLTHYPEEARFIIDHVVYLPIHKRVPYYYIERWNRISTRTCESEKIATFLFLATSDSRITAWQTVEELTSVLSSTEVSTRKACGPDNVPNWVLIECAEDLAPIVCHLFNASYAEGTVPTIWKSANVVPVPKAAGASQVEDFRPVSLLAGLAKLLERCILKRLLPSLPAVIRDQYAYMKGSSTTIALVRMVQTWLSALDSKKPTLVRALFADMSKAFDRVDHALLLTCVINLQASPYMVSWIHDYLQQRQQRVVTHGKFSTWCTLTSGVPQGCVLSPYLFLLFMSTRSPVYCSTLNVGYADDVSLSRTLQVAVADSDKAVEEEASQLDEWACDNKMTLNGKKSQLLQICFNRSVPVPPELCLGGQQVPCVGLAKGLGFILDKNLTFNEQVSSMVTKASRRLHYLRLLTKQGTSVADLLQIYITLIRPVLEYGHVLLVGCNKEQEQNMERVQKRALRIISLGGRREVPTWPTLKVRREAAAVKLLRNMLEENHPLHDMVSPARALASGRTLRNGTAITVPAARTQRLKNSFLHQAIRLYNKATQ